MLVTHMRILCFGPIMDIAPRIIPRLYVVPDEPSNNYQELPKWFVEMILNAPFSGMGEIFISVEWAVVIFSREFFFIPLGLVRKYLDCTSRALAGELHPNLEISQMYDFAHKNQLIRWPISLFR